MKHGVYLKEDGTFEFFIDGVQKTKEQHKAIVAERIAEYWANHRVGSK